ncbi:hypothetical protein F383_34751 [Gossypium arboreum]|uniref:Uncharacterized protein n=1 Tax=Gossypium arboreum TaxID=29729 RepID=A0A0B0N145_GOSAR|nr:hypothetical protein F383_34751 [Gossypium arboreum]
MPLSQTGSYTKSNTVPMSQTWSYTKSQIDANALDVVLHEITYQKYNVMTYVS